MPISANLSSLMKGTGSLVANFSLSGTSSDKQGNNGLAGLFSMMTQQIRPQSGVEVKDDKDIKKTSAFIEPRQDPSRRVNDAPQTKIITKSRQEVTPKASAIELSPDLIEELGLSDEDVAALMSLDLALGQILQLAQQTESDLMAQLEALRAQASRILEQVNNGELELEPSMMDIMTLLADPSISLEDIAQLLADLDGDKANQLMALIAEAQQNRLEKAEAEDFAELEAKILEEQETLAKALAGLSLHGFEQNIEQWQAALGEGMTDFPTLPDILTQLSQGTEQPLPLLAVLAPRLVETFDILSLLGRSIKMPDLGMGQQSQTLGHVISALVSRAQGKAKGLVSGLGNQNAALPSQGALPNAAAPKLGKGNAQSSVPTQAQNRLPVGDMTQVVGAPQLVMADGLMPNAMNPLAMAGQSAATTSRFQHVIQLQASQAAHQISMAVSRMKQSDGGAKFTMRLDPPEMGRVRVRMQINNDGHTQLRVIADKPETAAMLQRDSGVLQRALQEQGLKISSRDMSVESGSSHAENAFGHLMNGHGGEGQQRGKNGAPRGGINLGESALAENISLNSLFADDRVSYLA